MNRTPSPDPWLLEVSLSGSFFFIRLESARPWPTSPDSGSAGQPRGLHLLLPSQCWCLVTSRRGHRSKVNVLTLSAHVPCTRAEKPIPPQGQPPIGKAAGVLTVQLLRLDTTLGGGHLHRWGSSRSFILLRCVLFPHLQTFHLKCTRHPLRGSQPCHGEEACKAP